ncbi:MAG TPA: PD-(D/E)XK nuclease family protein, partial [Acidobacteriota bacterium]|nr:PD-(D/E)XK nuclease family protein [Acidobacteriota bacterium]
APEELAAAGVTTVDDFLERKRIESYVNEEILALKFATIFDILSPQLRKVREIFDIPGYPLFMGKTSPSARIMEHAAKYTKGFTPLEYIGGEWGIHADNDLPMLGICEPTAMGRLFGFFQAIAQQDGTEVKQYVPIPPKLAVQKVRYATHEEFPFLLIEQELPLEKNQLFNVTLPDVFGSFTEQQRTLISDFAYTHRLGFCAIQPRIVSLLTRDRSIYHDLRWKNKENSRWLYELEGKHIALPSEFPLASATQPIRLPTDVRGSEFTLPTNVRLTEELFSQVQEGTLTDVGCTINKLLAGLPLRMKIPFLDAQLAVSPQDVVDEYWHHHMPSHESYAAVRGNAIHTLCHFSDPRFAHNQTLSLVNLPIVESKEYAQNTYHMPWQTAHGPTLLHANPDVVLFIQGDSQYDALILDTKTNRVTSYPEHRYTLQTFFYGWFMKELFKEQGRRIENIYTVLNKQAFYRGFGGADVVSLPHEEYRRQQFSPITKFAPTSEMHALMPMLIDGIVEEKRTLLQDESQFIPYKERQQKCGRCDNCYLSDSLVCDRLAFLSAQKQSVTPFLQGFALDKSKV